MTLHLRRAAQLLAQRLEALEIGLQEADAQRWREYRETAAALAAVVAQSAPGVNGELLTTKQMAERLGVSPKTLLKRKIRPALKLGERGRAAYRWRGDEAAQ